MGAHIPYSEERGMGRLLYDLGVFSEAPFGHSEGTRLIKDKQKMLKTKTAGDVEMGLQQGQESLGSATIGFSTQAANHEPLIKNGTPPQGLTQGPAPGPGGHAGGSGDAGGLDYGKPPQAVYTDEERAAFVMCIK